MKKGILKTGREILKIEIQTLERLTRHIRGNFVEAVEMMVRCKGRIILTGMGKPGFIARKISATLASTGSPSFFLHPAEAIHGDLGMVTPDDILIAISNSGETEEIVQLLSPLKRMGVPMIALTSNVCSTLARHADIVLDLGVTREACPLNLAPSASTTASLALGDALALSLLKEKGFKTEDFAMLHPGGSLGKQLLKVKDIMRSGKNNPLVPDNATVRQALLKITGARAGSCTLVDRRGKIRGIFTDGDLRRHMKEDSGSILDQPVKKFATQKPMTIRQTKMAAEAVHLLKTKKIDELPVVDDQNRAVGLLDVQDLLKAGFV
ncbi:MAG: KpsF/GutQ family sugar-phosphate isomerase [Candidatus Omnitrophica bacterium]|nr:KpsF/GutQ family sugar-phosphate isomerase [Candidatus Omnitrophota bacterium]MDD5670301.1 KpsF/GutQ family sugar-phosphate isomerase [Candidatus Omnitrophota bacterium]